MSPEQAARLAERAHHGQRYGDAPYFAHVRDVAARVLADTKVTRAARVVAWLHDVIEDTPLSLTDLRAQGLAPEQAQALDAISRRRDEPYEAYIRRCAGNRVAALVKYHDLLSNLAHAPLESSLRDRYEAALPRIREARLGVISCRACDAPIAFLRTRRGKYMPVNRSSLPEAFDVETLTFDPKLGHESHYATCPDAARFRRNGGRR